MEFDKELWGQVIPDIKETEDDSSQVLFDSSIPMPDEDSIRGGMVTIISRGLISSLPALVVEVINANILLFSNLFVWPLVIYSFKKGYKKALEDQTGVK